MQSTEKLDSDAAMPHNLFVSNPMLTIIETSAFVRRAENLLSAEEHEELLFSLALHPLAGDEIPGTGGVRKVRFAARGKGKSGGVRVIYYFYDEENPLYALFIYGKNEQANPTPAQKKAFTDFAVRIKAAAKNRRRIL
jgi:mRNA-degrading endonuclease RelE of RelBE toxin-antitoxin system